jgi:hypothetical protein
MARARIWREAIAASSAVILLSSCLPSDDRPPPGNVTFTVSPSAAVRDGSVTEDGWTLSFTRLMLGIGRTGLNDGCAEYSEPRYDRLIDVTKGSGQKLSLVHGLGRCDVRFRIWSPNLDALLGTGVTESDRLFMGAYGTDAYAKGSTSVRMEGQAEKDGVVKTFRWSFRRTIRLSECRAAGDAGAIPPIELVGQRSTVRDIVIHGEALFREEPKYGASTRFAPFAMADRLGNDDGVVDLDELTEVTLEHADRLVNGDGGLMDASAPEVETDVDAESGDASQRYEISEGGSFFGADGASRRVETLRDFVYVILLPMLARLDGTERCVVTGATLFR